MLEDSIEERLRPLALFEYDQGRRARLMAALDEVNGRFGNSTAVFAERGSENKGLLARNFDHPPKPPEPRKYLWFWHEPSSFRRSFRREMLLEAYRQYLDQSVGIGGRRCAIGVAKKFGGNRDCADCLPAVLTKIAAFKSPHQFAQGLASGSRVLGVRVAQRDHGISEAVMRGGPTMIMAEESPTLANAFAGVWLTAGLRRK